MFKFALYVSIPVVMTALVAGNADVLETIIKNVCPRIDVTSKFEASHNAFTLPYIQLSNLYVGRVQRSYVVYPPEAPRPPSLEEFKEMAKAKQSKS